MTEKAKFLKKFNEAFANMDIPFIVDSVSDEIDWDMVGDRRVRGREEFEKALKEMAGEEVYTVEIDQIITHGITASVNGTMKSPKGATYGFCDVYVFSGFKNPKIRKITSYVVEIPKG